MTHRYVLLTWNKAWQEWQMVAHWFVLLTWNKAWHEWKITDGTWKHTTQLFRKLFQKVLYKLYILICTSERPNVAPTACHPHSEHRFLAPSSKLCQILVTPLKGHSLSPCSCPPTWSAPPERFGYQSHSEHRFLAPSSKLCQILVTPLKRHSFYLRAAVHQRGQHPPETFGY